MPFAKYILFLFHISVVQNHKSMLSYCQVILVLDTPNLLKVFFLFSITTSNLFHLRFSIVPIYLIFLHCYLLLYLAILIQLLLIFLSFHQSVYAKIYMIHKKWRNNYFRYGLQVATNFKKGGTSFPLQLPSHIISFIRLMTSLVLASSKNTTVSILCFLFSKAAASASFTH